MPLLGLLQRVHPYRSNSKITPEKALDLSSDFHVTDPKQDLVPLQHGVDEGRSRVTASTSTSIMF